VAGLPTKIAIGFVAAFGCVLASALVTFTFEAARDQRAKDTARALTTLIALEELEVATQGMATATEAAIRGTQTWEAQLEVRGRRPVEAVLRHLEEMVIQEPVLADRLQLIEAPLKAMVVASDGARRALQDGRREEAGRLAGALNPAHLLHVLALMEDMERVEEAILVEREASWRRSAVTGVVVFTGATLALLVFMFAAARTVRAEIRERERLAGALEAQVALQRQLMAVVGHDLRNPLATIKSGASLLARREGLSDGQREDAGRILSNARRMERLIRDLLDFTRLHAGVEIPVAPVEMDLVALSRRAISDLGRDAEGLVTVEGLADVVGVWDPDRLEQVVANLVSNALKYGPPRRPVRVRVDGRGDPVVFTVSDEGGSITPAERGSLFEPFRPGRGGRDASGPAVGLGLYVVRRIAEAHGGRVAVESDPQTGTIFTVHLPRGRAPRAGPPGEGG
jgi:signal transduction histidine kinase